MKHFANLGASTALGGGWIRRPMAETDPLQAQFLEHHGQVVAMRKDVDGVIETLDKVLAAIAHAEVGTGAGREPAGKKAFAQFLRNGPTQSTTQAGMRESSDPGGGYTVPTTIDRTIQDQLLEFSPLRQWASITTLSQGAGTYSFLVNRRGASSGWVGEEEARPETDTPKFQSITPPEGEIYANASITQWLLDDSGFDMDQFIRDNIIDEFAVQEGAAFVNGNGLNKPHGFLQDDIVSTGDATREFGKLQYIPTGVASALTDSTHNGTDALIDLLYSVKPAYRAGPGVGWMMNSTMAGTIRKLKDVDGRYVWAEAVTAGEPAMLLGYPVAIDENMPIVGANAYPVAFGNWRRGYRIVDRLTTRVLRDPYTNKPKVMFYLTKRVGGSLADSKAIKLLKVATT